MISQQRAPLEDFLTRGPYVGYSYSYPHKTAYRPLLEPRTLHEIWRDESQESLFLYVHIPFCEVRCGFCNLFTFSQPDEDLTSVYLSALRRQASAIRTQLPGAKISRLAIGGGTPSFLERSQLELLFDLLRDCFDINGAQVPISFEVSPSTLDADKLRCIDSFGVDRISMGIQSLNKRDIASLGRPQNQLDVYRTIDLIREHSSASLNLDLIYGAETQTLDSWIETVAEISRIRPDEIYLYPLYVRPNTGLANIDKSPSDQRLAMFRAARDRLVESGYQQVSMRMFNQSRNASSTNPEYRCQSDGMIGLGCGARSYTSTLHYGSSYAVKQPSILRLIRDFIHQTDEDFGRAVHGIALNEDEQRRRYLILSLLLVEGLDCHEYQATFGAPPHEHFSELLELCERGFATRTEGLSEKGSDPLRRGQRLNENDSPPKGQTPFRTGSQSRICLTASGLELSDTIGPWLYSDSVRDRMAEFPWTD